ncbi:MAG: YaiI/YqxD family protein [Thermoanaerobaculia bacterium]
MPPLHIYIDADACPVKEEVYRVARRYALGVTLVANAPQRIPEDETFTLVVVREGMDAADDWIAERAGEGDIVITADIPLAARCLRNGARVIGTTGRPFTEDNVGGALATRDILSDLRGAGQLTSGPPPFQKRDRSRFLQALDTAIQAIRRES